MVPPGESQLLVLRMEKRAVNVRIYGEGAQKMFVALARSKDKLRQEMGIVKGANGKPTPLKWEYRTSNDGSIQCYAEVARAPGYSQFRCEFYVDTEDARVKYGIFDE